MKRLIFFTLKIALLLAAAFLATACHGPWGKEKAQPRCGFSDPHFMTSVGLCQLVAEYYVAHRQWPLTREQLGTQLERWKKEAQTESQTEEDKQELAGFLDRFSRLELRANDENLVVRFRFRIDHQTTSDTLVFYPGATKDEIIESITETL